MSPLRLAILNLLRRRFTSLIALAALALPVAAGGTLHRIHHLADARFNTLDDQPSIVIGAKAGELDILLNSLNGEGDFPDYFTYNLYDGIKTRYVASYQPDADDNSQYWPPQEREHHLSERREVLAHAFGVLIFGKLGDARVLGTTESFWDRPQHLTKPNFRAGRPPQRLNEIAIGAHLAEKDDWQIGDRISIDPWVSNDDALNTQLPKINATVTGILEVTGKFWDNLGYTSIDQAKMGIAMAQPYNILHPVWQQNVLHYIIAYDQENAFPIVSQLINNATVAQAISVPAQLERLFQLTGTRQQVGLLISLLALSLGTLAVIGIMVTRFDLMRSQLNVLRAIGYRRGELSSWLLWEGVLLGLAAVVIGATLDFALFTPVRIMTGIITDQSITIPLWYSAPVWLCALAASVFATLIPLWRVFRQSVHHGLRQS